MATGAPLRERAPRNLILRVSQAGVGTGPVGAAIDPQPHHIAFVIGQFGVGFYSAFIVAERVTLISRAAGSETATRWYSTGDGAYTIEEAARGTRGTTVILDLKKKAKDEPLNPLAA